MIIRPLGRYPALPDGVANQVGGVVDVQLFHQPATVELRRFDTDMQDFRDLLGRLPLTHELQYLPLARRQLGAVLAGGRRAGVDDRLRGAGTDVQPAIAHFLYSVHEDRKSTRLNSSHPSISYAVFCLK